MKFPAIPVSDIIVFEEMQISLMVVSSALFPLVTKIKEDKHPVVLLFRKGNIQASQSIEDFDYHTTSALVQIQDVFLEGEKVKIIVRGIGRVEVGTITNYLPMLEVEAKKKPVGMGDPVIVAQYTHELTELMIEMASLNNEGDMDALIPQLQNSASPWSFFEQLVRFSFLPISELKNLIDLDTLESRFEYLVDYFEKEMAKSDLKQEVKNKLNKKLSDQEKRFLLREEMKIIEKELDKLKKERSKRGEDPSDNEMDEESMNEGNQDIKDFKKRIKKTEYPEEVLKILDKEMERLRRMHPSSPESAQTRDYIEWLLDLPWNISTKDKIDLSKAKDILESQHYGLEEVKTRILEYLAVCKLKKDIHGQVLCFVGPPGTGKTSIGKSIAESMNREFVHFSLGGMRDEAEIRGHRRTYVGSMPGRIVQRLKRVGVNNPVFMLDEIDKIGKDFKGDPASALLEVLDPSQNTDFNDHYIDTPVDLSKCVFLTTANSLSEIPEALLDRMEVVEMGGYTEAEKLNIVRKFLLPKQEEENGLKKGFLDVSDEDIMYLIRHYTREAGLRNLERKIASVCRKVTTEIVEKTRDKKHNTISQKDIVEFLGPEVYSDDAFNQQDEIGISTGLGWSPSGGSTLLLETVMMKGKGNLKLTGKLGDVMKESAETAFSYIKAHANKYDIDESLFENKDIHIHAPEGAIPKDGPSAGITITTALVSLLTQTPVSREVAMTGEVTLSGKVLAIGGLKEKSLAARRAGCKKVIIPKENEKDLQKFPPELLEQIEFFPVSHVDEVIKLALSK